MRMSEKIGTGPLLYGIAVSGLLLWFVGQWELERGRAKRAIGGLYYACESLQVLAPAIFVEPPIPMTIPDAMAQATDPRAMREFRVREICLEQHIEDFEKIKERRARRAKQR